ncbi:hypothetical protein [Chryseobacterium sp. Mn2064]|uniref:hypothetical protein n=1 Tax=Chryseobacterium sp. Mn2064 TaxID=3395263 RepID=UPI003BC6D7ED
MKTLPQLLIIILFTIISCHNQGNKFNIETITKDKDINEELDQLKNLPTPGLLYADKNYEVWKSCSGEWGGTVYFKSKESGKIYYSQADCPICVNKIDNKYYISTSMTHELGASGILEIDDPSKMEVTYKIPIYHPGVITREYEAHTLKGTKKIVDSTGISIMSSFVYDKKLYSFVHNYKTGQNMISEVKNHKFHTIQEIDNDLFSNDPIIIQESEDHQKIFLQHPKPIILEVIGKTIKVNLFKEKR